MTMARQVDGLALNAFQNRILKDAGIESVESDEFAKILQTSLDFVHHAEHFFKDPEDPDIPLHLETWQREELHYAQWGEGTFDEKGRTIRKPVAINSPRGFGKSIIASVIADEFAIHIPNTLIALFSTSQDQANFLMEKVRYFIKNSVFSSLIDKKKNSKTEFGLSNGSVIKAFPQSEVTIRGFHPHVKIIDEKSRIKREILESAIRPMGRKSCYLEIGISTPFGRNNNHYEDCMNNESFHTRILGPTDVTWVDKEKLAREESIMGKLIAMQELYGAFLEDADSVFKNSDVLEFFQDKDFSDLRIVEEGDDDINNYVLGTDFGKQRDYSVISVTHKDKNGNLIIDVLERLRKGISYTVVIARIKRLCELFNIKLIVPDGMGVGIKLMEDLEDAVGRAIIYKSKIKGDKADKQKGNEEKERLGFVFNNTSKLNLIAEMEALVVNHKVKCPAHNNIKTETDPYFAFKVLENETVGFVYHRTAHGNIVFGHPEDNKSHDDTLMAVMLANWGYRFLRASSDKIGSSSPPQLQRGGRLVKRTFGLPPSRRL